MCFGTYWSYAFHMKFKNTVAAQCLGSSGRGTNISLCKTNGI